MVGAGIPPDRVEFVEHHTAHAAAAYYGWGRYEEPVLVLTNDGAGDGLCASVSIGERGNLARISEVHESESIGNIYAAVTFLMGMVPLEHEYKLMGMAPYAPDKGRDIVRDQFRALMEFMPGDGTRWERRDALPPTYCSYASIEAMALGVPVVATRVPFGPEAIITDGETGIFALPRNPEDLAQKSSSFSTTQR